MNKISFSEILKKTLRGKHYRVKKRIIVKPKYKRDEKGRFLGGLFRKGYSYALLDKKSPKVSNLQLLAENIEKNNQLLKKFRSRQ